MVELNMRGFVAIGAEAITSDGKQWIEVMPTADKARNGRWYFTITRDDLDAYAAYIQANADRIPVDYDHEGADGGSTVAAGWFTGQAEVRDTADGPRLYAEVEWTPQGAEDVKNKRFRFISPEWSMQNKDAKTGLLTKAKEIVAATLTNRPFFRQLAPVARDLFDSDDLDVATADFGEDAVTLALAGLAGDEDQRAAAQRILGAVWTTAYINDLPDSAFLYVEKGSKDSDGKTTPRSLRHFPVRDADGNVNMPHLRNALARIPQSNLPANVKTRLASKAQQMLKQAGGDPAATEGDDMPDLTVLAKSLGLAEDADETAITEAVAAKNTEIETLTAKIADLEAKADVSDDLKRMATEGAQALSELREIKVDTLITGAVAAGKIPPVAKDAYATMAASDYDGTKALIDAMPDKSFKETGSGGDGDDGDNSDEKKEIAAAEAKFGRGSDEPVDGADLHVKAMAHLKEQGKDAPTQEEYAAALEIVSAS